MRSWDIFDTLIGRRCGTANRLFEIMGEILGDPDFVRKRKAAERFYQDQFVEYSLMDIYEKYVEMFDTHYLYPELEKIEWGLELINVFPIKRNAVMLKDEDILVSDMYLSENQLRDLLAMAGIHWDGPIYVSCYGKHKGTIWPIVKSSHNFQQHIGDNGYSDVQEPKRHGIRGTWADTTHNPFENKIAEVNFRLADWMRSVRLEHFTVAEEQNNLRFMQAQYNLPFLWAAAHHLEQVRQNLRVENLLFMSRDGQIFQKVYEHLYPERVNMNEYIYISRECLRGDSKSYFNYLNKRLTKQAMLVDLASSVGSLKIALPKLKARPPKVWCAIWLPSFGVDPAGTILHYLTSNSLTRINNTHVEMLNYATHWHVKDVKGGKAVLDQKDEYKMELVEDYHYFINKVLSSMPVSMKMSEDETFKIADMCLRRIEDESKHLRRTFPGHIELENKRKSTFVQMEQRKPVIQTGEVKAMVLGAIWKYEWPDCAVWMKSLQKSGYKGNIHVLSYDCTSKTDNRIRRAGASVSEHELQFGHVVVDRFYDISKLAEQLDPETWVICPDVGDIAFQYDPRKFLSTVPADKNILVASEGVRFNGNAWVTMNMKNSFPEYWHAMKAETLYNAGSFAAKAGVLIDLAMETWEMSMSRPKANSHDQAALNILLRKGKYQKGVFTTLANDTWCHCAASSLYAKPQDQKGYLEEMPVIKDGVLFVRGGTMKTCMFHHYDRNPRMKSIVRALYT